MLLDVAPNPFHTFNMGCKESVPIGGGGGVYHRFFWFFYKGPNA